MVPHVLVYDHFAPILARFQHGFQQRGYRATARFPREISPRQVEMLKPDVIVLGLTEQSPPGDMEEIQRIRDNATTQHIPVIISIPADAPIEIRLDDDGVTVVPYQKEPFNMDTLIAEVVRLVGEPEPDEDDHS